MNRLQGIPKEYPLFVSLNPGDMADPQKVHGTFTYDHPVLDTAAFDAQRRMSGIQGLGGIWYAGAWLGYGFHEDGLKSGLSVAAALGSAPSWAREMPAAPASPFAEAAE